MMFITPRPPSASVMKPTMLKNRFMVSTMRPNMRLSSEVSHTDSASRSSRLKPLRRASTWRMSRSSGQSTSWMRPVRASSTRGRSATTKGLGDTISCETTPGRHVGTREVSRHRGEGHEHLVVVGPAVVAVLVLLPDLADDRVRLPVQLDRLVQALARAEQLRPGVGADDGHPPRLLVVGGDEAAPVLDVDGADRLVLRLDAVDRQRGGVEAALDAQARD